MVDIEIEFCVPCGLLEPAQRVQAARFTGVRERSTEEALA